MAATKKRQDRQDEIRRIVRRDGIRTQHELAERLHEAGYSCTQATVSRDIAELDLTKGVDGHYVLAEDLHLIRMVSELVTSVVRTNNLVIVKALPGSAQGVAAALDDVDLRGILGSIAGDDTVLVITADEAAALAIEDRVNAHIDRE